MKNDRYTHVADLLRQVGHDLKSPLTAIIGTLETLTSFGDKLSDAQKQLLYKTGLKEGYRLHHFIQNIMLVSKFDIDPPQLEKTATTLGQVLTPLVAKLKQLHPHVSLNDVTSFNEVPISADVKWFSESLWQLLDNIGRHNASPVEASVKVEGQGAKRVIFVSDNGGGIPAEVSDEIFDRYVKGPATMHQDASAGLGLSIARYLIEAQGGTLILDKSEPGAVFKIVLNA